MFRDIVKENIPLNKNEMVLMTGLSIKAKELIPINNACPPGCGWNGFYRGDYRDGFVVITGRVLQMAMNVRVTYLSISLH